MTFKKVDTPRPACRGKAVEEVDFPYLGFNGVRLLKRQRDGMPKGWLPPFPPWGEWEIAILHRRATCQSVKKKLDFSKF
ncbi:hypothetical protein Pmar_PMAR025566 [Perkinsus marinus ATCC 50983]|uniref:Uncharacterized protein n=1 Tax=Perkinsus marinus (strain ATCC 50983 / TXsc) TaxID=423536 RepID=C5LZE5_PERM5|nr:hypothetical protein Pmar_PMAR025566 [Perkinsus marinus ATCC 50983]EEQ97939.1 hypothetical protein Pmar_PMAR025566 [Perkinsus marinus ATCC 50983]|eukprot:XP_002765222.1 hypothetical protein Pmar_PMAR025566 [Perkinsus marinus ATCC 50983]